MGVLGAGCGAEAGCVVSRGSGWLADGGSGVGLPVPGAVVAMAEGAPAVAGMVSRWPSRTFMLA
ncbi:hypothetical protein, partial [Streptomyces sp. P17]|uniref:hypothetical protein n=1 Tax=Streptomyces sp. P17 TaxID=3074716 RepID=UPI0028F3EFD1